MSRPERGATVRDCWVSAASSFPHEMAEGGDGSRAAFGSRHSGPPDTSSPGFLLVAGEDTEADRGRRHCREGREAQSTVLAAGHPQVTPPLRWHPGGHHG